MEYSNLRSILLNQSGKESLAKRFRALFSLRGLGTTKAIQIIGEAFETSSALLGHELAYCLGQIGSKQALPILEAVLKDSDQHPMVRHEAAEAMGAISDLSSVPLLQKYKDDPDAPIAVRETCEIALEKIQYDYSDAARVKRSKYDSIDPAPPLASAKPTIADLEAVLLDTKQPLFERYRAMFALRNDGSDQAVLSLAKGFSDPSALFRHEVAYIFGQLSSPASIPSLSIVLDDRNEDEMVRHEAAEALGSIATAEVYPLLHKWLVEKDSPQVVRESCQVALDIAEYENSGELHYATKIDVPVQLEQSRSISVAA